MEASGVPSRKLLARGAGAGLTRSWFGEHIWLSVVGPLLEASTQKQESWQSLCNPGHLEPVAAGVAGETSIVIYGLATVTCIPGSQLRRG